MTTRKLEEAHCLVIPLDGEKALAFGDEECVEEICDAGTRIPPDLATKIGMAAATLSKGLTLPGKISGKLVELDSLTASMMRSAELTMEHGGWIQGNLRIGGRWARVSRFRPTPGTVLGADLASLVQSVAIQAQLKQIQVAVDEVQRVVDRIDQRGQARWWGDTIGAVSRVNSAAQTIARSGYSETLFTQMQGASTQLEQSIATAGKLLREHVATLERAAQMSVQQAGPYLARSTAQDFPENASLDAAAQSALIRVDAVSLQRMILHDEPSAEAFREDVVERLGGWIHERHELHERAIAAIEALKGAVPPTWKSFMKFGLVEVRKVRKATTTFRELSARLQPDSYVKETYELVDGVLTLERALTSEFARSKVVATTSRDEER